MNFSEALRRFRKERGLTQKEVALAIGIREAVYQRYEQERAVPSVNVLIKIANTFNVSADYLLGRTDSPNSTAKPVVVDSSIIEEIRRSAIAELDRQIALKFPNSGFTSAAAV